MCKGPWEVPTLGPQPRSLSKFIQNWLPTVPTSGLDSLETQVHCRGRHAEKEMKIHPLQWPAQLCIILEQAATMVGFPRATQGLVVRGTPALAVLWEPALDVLRGTLRTHQKRKKKEMTAFTTDAGPRAPKPPPSACRPKSTCLCHQHGQSVDAGLCWLPRAAQLPDRNLTRACLSKAHACALAAREAGRASFLASTARGVRQSDALQGVDQSSGPSSEGPSESRARGVRGGVTPKLFLPKLGGNYRSLEAKMRLQTKLRV